MENANIFSTIGEPEVIFKKILIPEIDQIEYMFFGSF
jgi:hypothetical protein